MISAPCFRDFRAAAGCFLVSMMLVLSGCGKSEQWSGLQKPPSSDGRLWFAATMTYEDRQMMRRYLEQGLRDGFAVMAEMQAKIDCSHDQE